MAQRGRKSAASLAVVTTLPGQRPEPPPHLTEDEAEEWRAVAATKPADWFGRDSHALLADYCRHVVMSRRVAEQVARFDPEMMADDEGLKRYEKLGVMLDRHSRAVASLATKMRMTQQSRYNALSANTAANRVGEARKPWEMATG